MARTPPRSVAHETDEDEDASNSGSDSTDELPTLEELLRGASAPAKPKGPIVNVRSVSATPVPTRIVHPSPASEVIASVRRHADLSTRTMLIDDREPQRKSAVPKPATPKKKTVTKTAETRRPTAYVPSRAVATIDTDSGSEKERKPSLPRKGPLTMKTRPKKDLPKKTPSEAKRKPKSLTSEEEAGRFQGWSGSDIVFSDSDSKTFVSAVSTRYNDVQSSSEQESTRRVLVVKKKAAQRANRDSDLEDMFSKASISKPTPRRRLVQKKHLDELSSSSTGDSETLREPSRPKPRPKSTATKRNANVPFIWKDISSSSASDNELSGHPADAIVYPSLPEHKTSNPVSMFVLGCDGEHKRNFQDEYKTAAKKSHPEVIEISSNSESGDEDSHEDDDDMYESEDAWIVEDEYGGYKRPKIRAGVMTTATGHLQDRDRGDRWSEVQQYIQDEADEATHSGTASAAATDDSDIADGNGSNGSGRCYRSSDSHEILGTPRTVTKSKLGKSNLAKKRDFEDRKVSLAKSFVRELDEKLCFGAVGMFHKDSGGIKVEWSKTLRTTAGRARMSKGIIELSAKVITDEERLYNTTAHEFCHLAVYAVDRSKTDMHGPLFKKWGALASRKFSHLGIMVTRVHNYEIEYRYHLSCQTENCTYVWKQQTKPKRSEYLRCPRCRLGVLLQTKPTPRNSKITDYNVFIGEHLSRIKRENPELPMKEAMMLLGQEWKAHKDGGMLSSAAGGKPIASGGEWSSSDSAPKKYPLTNMMDRLKI